ncbi:TetR family transcriptional regulator [Jatrophihabitans sp. GAS493]|uniref:TetR family transcriptional regulator n=1 Tax=Jatrophihabitans sp. GAS493 TaxID=1907575 RepID=UPI000BB6B4CC|nr:TetR family transcriptional regulator [Jatrophihabitans sp. GAS493]SOD74588.1 TetR family transcriptional regulator [Jatrophihabitans sp. GAS493]
MVRWQPDAAGRLGQAAMELYIERGYEQTTVAEIAERAGLTARTFFRYYADKREVLFAGSGNFQANILSALDASPASVSAMEAISLALGAAASALGPHHEHARQRYSVIAANAELRERELTKMASLAVALAAGLRGRGVTEPEASLAAETGVAVFRVAFERWVTERDDLDLSQVLRDSFAQLRSLSVA